jgi:putative ubiquitin-RnfH superfamily antitoxin RatB of RatAB toxin-antitoxin module
LTKLKGPRPLQEFIFLKKGKQTKSSVQAELNKVGEGRKQLNQETKKETKKIKISQQLILDSKSMRKTVLVDLHLSCASEDSTH